MEHQEETTKLAPKYRIGFAIFEAICTAIILIAVSYSPISFYFGHYTNSLPMIEAIGVHINSARLLHFYLDNKDLTEAIILGFTAICCLNIIFKLIFLFTHKLRTKWLSIIVLLLGIASILGTLVMLVGLQSEAKGELYAYFGKADISLGSGAIWLIAGTVLLFFGMMVALAEMDGSVPKKPTEPKEESQEDKTEETIPTDTPQEENKEEEKTQETTAPIVSRPHKKTRKLPYIIGGLAGLGILAALAFFVPGDNKAAAGNDLLPVQKPAWDKFVILTQHEVTFHKEPDISSPELEIMHDYIDSDNINFTYKWSNEPTKTGFVSITCTLNENEILPMIVEVGDWYKVLIYDSFGSMECYIHKAQGHEVTPQPITQELLSNINIYNYVPATFGLQTEGKYKNFCFISVNSDMEGPQFDFAILYDGVLVNPRTKRIVPQLYPENHLTGKLVEVGIYENDYALFYDDRSLKDGMFNAQVLGTNGIADEAELDRLFNDVYTQPSNMQEISYYFPSVATDRIFTFPQFLDESTTIGAQ